MKRTLTSLVVGLLLTVGCATESGAVPPHDNVREAQRVAAGERIVPDFADWRARGICQPDTALGRWLQERSRFNSDLQAAPAAPFRVLCLLVDFSDHTSQVAPTFFDSLVFSDEGQTVRDYFSEVSLVTIDLVTVNLPSSIGWNRAPQSYAYYVNGNHGTGSYPQNSQKLVEDLVDQVDSLVDFSNYDNDNNGSVDVLLVVHSGSGAEFTGNSNDIWSHKWGISPRWKDGVYISSFTVQPEFWTSPGDMTIGVYSHELLHGFGLPDLYDTDGSSRGIGKWGIMAAGSWNGPSGRGGSPAWPCAWSRINAGFDTSINVVANRPAESIPSAQLGGPIFRLWTSGGTSSEHFLVENRQRTGYDTYLPGEGLLIWHIDDAKSGNQQEWWPGQPAANHYLVALEQADGAFALEHRTSSGNSADPFPGTNNVTQWDDFTTPSSNTYAGGQTFVAVDNISSSGDTMTADLIVGVAADVNDDDPGLPTGFTLDQNYPNPFNPSTVISFTLDESADVELTVYNIIGQRVATLWSGLAPAGRSDVTWDGRTQGGSSVASGTYFYRLTTESGTIARKMVLLK